jgi:diguanylate cyclase (GGDEF)-like protein
MIWGVGQLLLAVAAARGALAYPAVGDLVSAAAAPLGVLGIALVPRTSTTGRPGLRLSVDAALVGLAGMACLWWVWLEPAMAPGVALAEVVGTLTIVMLDVMVCALVVLVAVRDRRSRITAAALGVLLHVVADVLTLLGALSQDTRPGWVPSVLWCVAWPLVALGIERYRPTSIGNARDRTDDVWDERAAHVATGLAVVLAVSGLVFGWRPSAAGPGGVIGGLLVLMAGVREGLGTRLRSRLTQGLRDQALHDPLTGLANRRAVTARIASLAPQAQWVVLVVDLDGFKEVNDLLGHHRGDELLVATARALTEQCPPPALAARIGGDEFAVLSPGGLVEGRALAERLRAAVQKGLEPRSAGLALSASVGVGRLVARRDRPGGADAARPEPGGTDRLTALVESAAALRTAKAQGRDRVVVYAGDVAAARERRLVVEQRLREAVAGRLVRVDAQPLVHLGTGRRVGYEALARWRDPDLGEVPPDEFIAVAEQTGLVVELGEHLLRASLREAVASGVIADDSYLSVNVSPVQLRVPGFAGLVRAALAEHAVPASQLVVEVTEAILVADDDPAVRTLSQLAESGVRIAIDDFGTGYSALGYLRRLPVHLLKVDRSLTVAAGTEPRTLAIVLSVVELAHRIGLDVVMEGVEDERMAARCAEFGADIGQGWYFGRPGPWSRVTQSAART